MNSQLFFLTGISYLNPGGTGRFLQVLKQQFDEKSDITTNFFKPFTKDFSLSQHYHHLPNLSENDLCDALVDIPNMVVCHPQGLNLQWTINLIKKRKHTWYFVLDAGFFCLRSYNHLPQEYHACDRCLGGSFSASHANDCKPFPYEQESYEQFFTELHALAKQGRVSFITQNKNNTTLVKKHFGETVTVHRAGICADYNFTDSKTTSTTNTSQYDIVFHANQLPPKGMFWAMRLAQKLPKHQFLFPFNSALVQGEPITDNMHFKPLTWETGLKDSVMSSKITLCTSMWSAPIEGALIKSLYYSNCVGVIDEKTSYSNQLPADILLRLTPDINLAAAQIETYLSGDRLSYKTRAHTWLNVFKQEMDNLHEVISHIVLEV